MTRLLIALLVAGAIVAQNPETPSYPGGVPSFAVLNQSAQTTLATSIDASATSIILNDAARFVAPVIITIGTEKIYCTTRTVNTLSVCTRGYNVGNGATTAAEHTSGEAVYGYIEPKTINQQSAEIVAIATYAVPNTRTVNGHALNTNVIVTKPDVGLGNADNTSDANKPISTATQAALDGKMAVGAAIAAGQLPQFTTGDATTPSAGSVAIAVGRVNGVSYGSSPALHSSPVVTATNATTYKEIPECAKGLTFAQSTDTYGCMPAAGPITDGYFSASDYAAFAAAIASKSPIDNPEFTTAATAPKFVTNDATHTGKDEMKPGTSANFDPSAPIAAGNFALYFNSANANHLTKRDGSGNDTDLEAGSVASGYVATPPANPTATGTTGQYSADATYFYMARATNQWGRIAWDTGWAGGTVATPTDSPGAGTYATTQTVTLSDSTSGATICYTTDNSTPAATTPGTCSTGTTYSSGFSVAATATVKAIGTKSGMTNSAMLTSVYTISSAVATPSFSAGTATYNADQSITITDGTSGAAICYTTDGSTPAATTPGTCSTGTTYSTPVAITATSTALKAIATKAGMTNSAMQSATYTLQAATPTASPAAGAVANPTTVTFSSTTTGTTFHYTTDGVTDPTCSTGTTGPSVSVTTATTYKVVACKANYADSAVATSAYTIGGSAPLQRIAGASNYSAGTATLATSTTLDVQAHDTLVIFAMAANQSCNTRTATISSNGATQTYTTDATTPLVSQSNTYATGCAAAWVVKDAAANSTATFTVSYSVSQNYTSIIVAQFRGADNVNTVESSGSKSVTGSVASTLASDAFSTSYARDALVVGGSWYAGKTVLAGLCDAAGGSNCVIGSTTAAAASEYRITTATITNGTVGFDWTGGTTSAAEVYVVLKGAN